MNDAQTRAHQITSYFLNNRFSVRVERDVQVWLLTQTHVQAIEQSSLRFWDNIDTGKSKTVSSDLSRVLGKIHASGSSRTSPTIGIEAKADEVAKTTQVKTFSLQRYLTRIAAVLIPIMFAIGGYMIYTGENSSSTYDEFTEITVAMGEEKQLTLPDGTAAIIGEGSKLDFRESEDGKSRIASLSGKASFSVKKNAEKPFIVETPHLKIHVLGTVFDVHSYPGNATSTVTLNRGSVEVHIDKTPYTLEPGQKLEYNTQTGEVNITDATDQAAESTAETTLNFTDASLSQILESVEAKYGIKVETSAGVNNSRDLYCVDFDDNEDISQVMSVLKDLIDGFSYKIEKDKVIVRKR